MTAVDLLAGFPFERRCTFVWEQHDWRSIGLNVLVLSVGMRARVLIFDSDASGSLAACEISGSAWVALWLNATSTICFSTLLSKSSSSGDPFGAVVPRLGGYRLVPRPSGVWGEDS